MFSQVRLADLLFWNFLFAKPCDCTGTCRFFDLTLNILKMSQVMLLQSSLKVYIPDELWDTGYRKDLSTLITVFILISFFFFSFLSQPFWWQRTNINRSTQFAWVFLRLLFTGWRQVKFWKGRRHRPYCFPWYRKLSPGRHDIASWRRPHFTTRKTDTENQYGSGGCEVFKSYSYTPGGQP